MNNLQATLPAEVIARMGDSKMAPASLEGQTLGKYRVLEPLGRGGMAQVYRAYHPQLDRYVAIKVLRSDLVEDEEFLARFRREARAVAALRHPNIVQVFDFDVHGDIYYMVMELLEGDTLKTRLNDYRARQESMPPGEVVRILLDVLDGLAYAHSEGMIHRDIKPANILLTRRGQAVVADFGIAQIVGGTQYTVSGALMGTLNYMAPEQGLESHSDARSDIYSLGIVYYEMLTQRTPFDADTPLAILMKHLNDPLPLPRQVAPAIPEPFERVVLKALAKRPEERYQSAAEMAQALRQAAEVAGVELPARISLPLSFTTTQSPAESVAVLSGTARQKIADAGFAADDTDGTLGQRLAAERAAKAQAGDEVEELRSALGALGRLVASKTAYGLRRAVAAVEQELAEAPPKEAADQTEAAGGAANQYLSGEATAPSARPGPPESSSPSTPAGGKAWTGWWKPGRGGRRARKLAEGPDFAPRQASSDALDGAPQETQAEERPEVLEARRRGRKMILSAVGLLALANLVAVWLSGALGRWDLFLRVWPMELLLTSVLLCAVMIATRSIWLLIPVGLVWGNGLLFSYYSLTGNWAHWSALWPLEPLLIIGALWLPIRLARHSAQSDLWARRLGMALGAVAISWSVIIGLLAVIVTLLQPA
jgi:tRNA A-37 threonylcarbamoyl transferase component Bud32